MRYGDKSPFCCVPLEEPDGEGWIRGFKVDILLFNIAL